ncbi:hypothetical protein KKC88_02405 [Patescibacteria group bacterium]|nr:hypothetical protein [Patescibacteria group bacterium]MBU1672948.1 hypothetical protein [Patescibacteria group bacterium]
MFKYNPIPVLLKNENEAIIYWTKKDLLKKKVGPVSNLWILLEPEKIIKKQQKNGRWKYPTRKKDARTQRNYDFLETYRQLRYLVDQYGLNKKHPAIPKTANFLFSFQTKAGDLRGIYGKQYSPNYSAAVFELLIKAGYQNDPKIIKGLNWLLSMRQDDGAWTFAVRNHIDNLGPIWNPKAKLLEPDRSKPFCHLFTDPILRAFAAHPKYRRKKEVRKAGELLKTRFFKPDTITDHRDKKYWTLLRYPPFAYCDLLSSLDALSKIGFTKDDPDIKKGLVWFTKHQNKNGTWSAYNEQGRKDADLWVTLAVCRIFKNFYK